MEKIKESIKELLSYTKRIISLDGIKLPNEEVVDQDALLEVLNLAEKGELGKGNDYSEGMRNALFCKKMSELLEENDELREILSSYGNFLLVDSLVKYILAYVRENEYLGEKIVLPLNSKVRTMNEYVRKNGPKDALKDCIDKYLEIGHMILTIVVFPTME